MALAPVRTGRQAAAPAYRCFLVRCRLEEGAGPNGEPSWRFTVQQVRSGAARRSFTSLSDVATHLEAELAACGGYADRTPHDVSSG